MSVRVMRWVIIFLSLSLPAAATAQQPAGRDPSTPSPGSAISVPLPNERQLDLSHYEIPELAGAEVARGSHLVDGRLPRPLVHYSAAMGGIRQRLSIFENGMVAISLTGAGGSIRKRMILPPDALEAYTKALSADTLDQLPSHLPSASPTQDRASLRIYRPDGTFVERTFNPVVVQNITLGKPTMILNDLLRALSEDREVTNPLTGYTPRVGDHLIADDEQTYRVVRILDRGNYVELISTREPLTLYVATKDLTNYFIGRRRNPTRDE